MADYTRDLPTDVFDCTTVDNNAKSEAGVGPPMVQVAPEGDEFGAALDGNWIEIPFGDIVTSGLGKDAASIAESGGKLNWSAGNSDWGFGERRTISYKDLDLVIIYDPTDPLVESWAAAMFILWKQKDNCIRMEYEAQRNICHRIAIYKYINGVKTIEHASAGLGSQAHIELRIKRTASTNTFTFYYRTSGDPTAWTEIYSAVITDVTHFPTNCDLYPIACSVETQAPYNFDPSCDNYYQKIDGGIAAQRFWPDSPEASIKDSANCGGGESYAFDAAVGKTWSLTGASSVEDGDGGTVRWKVGFSDAADGSGITWDGTWQTIAQVNTNAGNGNYDGHRYLYVKWQGNGTSAQQPNATSFTISGAAVGAGIASSIFESSIFKSGVFR